MAPSSGSSGIDPPAAGFAADSPEVEIWSAPYHPHLDPARLRAGDIAAGRRAERA